jgi:hypothetical protein
MGISCGRANTTATTWDIWRNFCSTLTQDPTTATLQDPIPLLQVFAHRYRTGELSPSHSTVRGCTVGDALRAVGQTLAHLGLPDPRITPNGKLDLRLTRQL